jgi:hypothetical protein
MLIQLNGQQAERYKAFLELYRQQYGEPKASERCEAYICAIEGGWKGKADR